MIAIGVICIVLFVVAISWRPSDPDSRSFVPDDKVAPTTSSGAYEAGLAGCPCPDGTCIASRGENLTGWTVNGRISTQYPPAVTRPEPVQPQPARLPAPKPELPPGVTEVPIEINVGGVWIRKEDLYRR